jgi:hypothetical protein
MKNVLNIIVKVLTFKLPIPLAGVVLLMILSGVLTGSLIRNYPQVLGLVKGQGILQKEEEDLVRHIGTLISLPKEKPSVATISDKDKLGDQPFFKNAKNGDKVLIFTNAKKVILYRPSEDRIVEVGSVNIKSPEESGETSPSPTPTPSPTPKSMEE